MFLLHCFYRVRGRDLDIDTATASSSTGSPHNRCPLPSSSLLRPPRVSRRLGVHLPPGERAGCLAIRDTGLKTAGIASELLVTGDSRAASSKKENVLVMLLHSPQVDVGFRHSWTKGSPKPPGPGFLSVSLHLVLLGISFYYSTPSSCTVGYSSSDPHLVRKESHSPRTKSSKLQPPWPRISSHMFPLNPSLWPRGRNGMVNFAQVYHR